MFYPNYSDFIKKSSLGNVIPIYREIFADMDTPVSAYLKINNSKYSFLLESVEGGEKWARYSFLGTEPSLIFKSKGEDIFIERDGNVTHYKSKDPLAEFKKLMCKFTPVDVCGLPRFFGGAVGYVGYDFVRFIENLPEKAEDDFDAKDLFFIITDTLLIFDNVKQKIKITANTFIKQGDDLALKYADAKKKINKIIEKLKSKTCNGKKESSTSPLPFSSNFSKLKFISAIKKAKDYVRDGDIIQVVLSQRFKTKLVSDPFNIYRALRVINPSPYMFYLKFDDEVVIGSSPEILVRLEDRKIDLRPIAGTRKRGTTQEEDIELEKELLADPKERAEHVMLVDLGRNDVGRVAKIGTVKVTELMVIEKYSHVMHIASNVKGILDDGKDAFDLLKATFPAGTVTGAPKVRAMEIIEEIEPTKRGIYAGSVGYFSFSGNMDMCITIRTLFVKDNTLFWQAGAGIVADSKPLKEYQETINKAKAMVKALRIAGKGF